MRNDLTDITIVLDRSGSMTTVQQEAEHGLNHFISEQKNQPTDAIFTLVQFDTEYEFVHSGIPIQSVPHCKLEPRGWTALFDALGRAIQETGSRLGSISESDRPGLVLFVILTDGQENSSKEYKKDQIKSMIEHQQSHYNWKFIFLGANQDSFAEADALGIQKNAAANFSNIKEAFGTTSSNIAAMRVTLHTGDNPTFAYSDIQRKRMA